MKTKISPAMVGFFVLGAFALAFIALLSFGGVSLFSKPQRFIVYFDESTHGLDLGSPVKMRGVRVGRVVDLNVRYNARLQRSEVAVTCEMNHDKITDEEGHQVNVADRAILEQMVDRGLRAQLGVLGLATGMLYVELDFLDPEEFPADKRKVDTRYVYIPAVPSAISEYQASLSEILSDLKKVDFAGISKDTRALLADVRKQVNKIEVRDLIAEWTRAAESVNQVASSPELRQAIVHFDEATIQLRSTLATLEAKIDPTASNLNETLAATRKALDSFNATAASMRQFISANQNLGGDASAALTKIGEAADAVQRLSDYLERNPSSLLSGRKKPSQTP